MISSTGQAPDEGAFLDALGTVNAGIVATLDPEAVVFEGLVLVLPTIEPLLPALAARLADAHLHATTWRHGRNYFRNLPCAERPGWFTGDKAISLIEQRCAGAEPVAVRPSGRLVRRHGRNSDLVAARCCQTTEKP
ncbi:hypothetical protein [Leifsonia sp. 22587]|uniref:hypothetical protein n=1 Tax=Leifsonia sp. 22587 TaxID=3453946 RepID=UPI003F8322EF